MMKRIAMLAWLVAASTLAVSTAAEDWPRFLGPELNGISEETGLLKSWPEGGPKELWRVELGSGTGFSAVSVADGRAFTLYQQKEDAEGVPAGQYAAAWDAETGEELWKVRLGDVFNNYPGPRSAPTVDGDVLYAVSSNGDLACLKAADGAEVWKMNLLQDFGAANLTWGVAFSPLVDGDRLVVNPGKSEGNSVAVLNKETGATIWTALNDVAGYSSPQRATLGGVDQYVFFLQTGAVGLPVDGGEALWRFPWETAYDVHAATPIIQGDRVLITSGYGVGAALFEVGEDQTPKEIWRSKNVESQFLTPILYDGHLYSYKGNGCRALTCVEFATGETKWEQEGMNDGSAVMAGGMLYALGRGDLYLVNPTPEKFDVVSKVEGVLNRRCWTMPVVANGKLYLRDESKLICLDVAAE